MTMTLRLDTAGLRALIEDNPEFKIDIQKSVMDNINKDNLDNAVLNRLEQVLKSMGTGGDYYNPKITLTDPALIAAMTELIKNQVSAIGEKEIDNLIKNKVQERLNYVQSELRSTIKETMISVLTPEIVKEILLSKFA